MSKKSSHAQKKMITLIIKQIYKSPKNLAKERAECVKIGVKLQYEQQKVQERRELVQIAASVNTSFHFDDYGTAHVERTLNYCGCKPLVKVLFEM
ncbi:hypothetical protein HPULCUR_006984 [Helicostylum pulchrum]|uniref:Uncharacterized protein n=1 Tax=Helicostylum pulchrum TaxID=562976 RepID=A0ABP9Y3K5_9FUNG